MADYRETVNSLAMNEQIVKLRQKIEIEQKLKQRLVTIFFCDNCESRCDSEHQFL